MELVKYDNKHVRIITVDGEEFEGIGDFNYPDYNMHEYARDEISLDLVCWKFFECDIAEVISLEDHDGPYGKFSGPYGELEIQSAEDGIDLIDEFLTCEENESVLRMIACIKDRPQRIRESVRRDRKPIIKCLADLVRYDDDETVKEKAGELKEILEKEEADEAV